MPGAVTAFLALPFLGSTVGVVFAKVALSLVLSSVLSRKPSSSLGLGQGARDQQITTRDPIAPWRTVYGETRAGGTIVFMHSTPILANQYEARVENAAVATAVFVGTPVNPWAADSAVYFVDYDPATGENSYTALTKVSGAPAAGQYSVSLVSGYAGQYLFNAADFGKNVNIHYDAIVNQSTVGKRLHLVIELAGHEVEEIGDIYFDDQVVTLDGIGNATGRYHGLVYISKHLGTEDQLADPALISFAPGVWTSEHRLRGRAYIYVMLIKNEAQFPNGVPNIRADIKGKKVYDPRSGLSAWSANPALCIADYLTSAAYGLGASYADEIDQDLLEAAANVCDETVTLASGGTQSRYTCNGSFLTSEQPKDILGRLQASMAGHVVRSGGRWGLYAGAWRVPTESFSENDLRGAIKVTSRVSRRDLFNGVKGVHASPANGYQPADFPAVTNATYLAEDQNEPAWLDVELPWTDTPAMAQRIAKIELERVRQQITVVMPCKLSALRVRPPDVVQVTNAKFGWTDKPFQVMELRLVTEAGEDGAPYMGVDLVLRETAESVYDWNSGEETTVDPAPDTNLPNPFAVAPPGTPAVSEVLYETSGSAGVKSRAVVTWGGSGDAQAVQYGLEYRRSPETLWTRRPLVRDTADTIEDLTPGTYEFRVRGFNNIGVASAYSATTTADVVGLSAPPQDVSGFSVIKSAGFGLAQWTLHPDLDVQINGTIVIRHSPLTSGATWQDGVIVETFPGGLVSGIVPLITGTYMAKALDSSGNYSESMTAFVATEGMVTGFNTVGTSTQHPDFTGAKTNIAFDGDLGGIKLDGTTLIDDMVTDIDDWPFIDGLGGVSGTGSYAFDAALDLGSVATRRFEADIKVLSFDTGDTIDDKLDPIDSWGPIDGDVIDDCDVTLYARLTDDDPSGSPVWGPWTPFFVADFDGRAAQFKLDFVTATATHNIVVTELAVMAKEPA